MAVTEQTPLGGAVGNGVTTIFPFGYYVAAAADLVVLVDAVEVALNVTYTVIGAGNEDGGQIVFAVAPASGAQITHYRDTALARSTDYQTAGDLFAAVLNLDVDRLWLALQEIFNGGKGAPTSIRVPAGETVPSLPAAADRANKLIAFDSNGNPIVTIPVSGSSAAFAVDLASSASAIKGPAMVGFNATLNYAASTLGRQAYDQPLNPRAFPWLAKFDGVTDDTAAINACATAARAGGVRAGTGSMMLPASGTAIVSSSLNFTGLHVVGFGGLDHPHIKASSAQFDVITTAGATTLEGVHLHGGWDGMTSGQSGDAISIKATNPAYPYNVHLRNVRVIYAKKRGIYWERAGYSSAWNVQINACGLHALELFGNSGSDAATTVQIGGFSIFSDCPFGYGVKMTECINVAFNGAISENTKGVQIAGVSNRALMFHSFYQENTSGNKFVDWSTSSGIGFDVRGCFGGGAVIDYNGNWLEQYYGANSNLTEPAVPYGNRVIIADGGEQAVVAAGSITAANIALPPGTWELDAYVQTINSVSGAVDRLGARLTLNAADGGLDYGTSALNFGTHTLMGNPGTDANLRVQPSTIVQNQTGASVTYYLRAYIGRTAGTVSVRGAIRARKIS